MTQICRISNVHVHLFLFIHGQKTDSRQHFPVVFVCACVGASELARVLASMHTCMCEQGRTGDIFSFEPNVDVAAPIRKYLSLSQSLFGCPIGVNFFQG